jgi:hypothetical protein
VRIRNYATQVVKKELPRYGLKPGDPGYIHRKSFPPKERPPPAKEWHLITGVLLTRPPLLLPEPEPFEVEVQNYLSVIERHQYSRFPVNFFFKQGSIAEKRWRQEHPKEPKKSRSGILREFEDMEVDEDEGQPEWIIGGTSDEQVLRTRLRAPPPTRAANEEEEQEELSEDERRDLEMFAEEEEFDEAEREVDEEVNMDLHRIEREPEQTLYCLVKKSKAYHEKIGRPERGWSLIEGEAIHQVDSVEGLHLV